MDNANGCRSGNAVSTGIVNESDDSGNLKRKNGSGSANGDSHEDDVDVPMAKKLRKLEVPIFVEPIRTVKFSESEVEALPLLLPPMENLECDNDNEVKSGIKGCRQFWKAGDYERNCVIYPISDSVGMDHVRVHPKFLHSNATSHKWALGAFAELLDNSLDEVCNGATYVHIDMLRNHKDGTKMLLIEDDGGGMCPDKMRSCVSLGYSSKRNMPNTIGQYGNGFKTSTMRLGADVLVFSRWKGNDQRGPTQSIGMLSYTFLRDTGKEDIVVPMVDFEFKENCWNKMMRSEDDWNKNLEIIAQWSPYSTQQLLEQFNFLKENGTRIIIYNLWEDDEGHLELDFDADSHDIQIRGANRDEKNIKMAQQHPNSRHYLTYRHSLRTYASILYLRLPVGFRIIVRGKDVEHHSIVDDLMLTKLLTYKPTQLPSGTVQNRYDMSVMVTIGFVKDAQSHIDVQGFNVYHKNRLIKPFWRIWNPAGSDGRGVIGVLEANFIEPAHDKQGFERTIVLSRLESRLIQIQKDYWRLNCHEVGYAARRRSSTESRSSSNNNNNNMDNLNSGTNQNSQNSGSSLGPTPHTYANQWPGPSSTGMVAQPLPAAKLQPVPASLGRVNQVFGQPQYLSSFTQKVNQAFLEPKPQLQPPIEQTPTANFSAAFFANNESSSLQKMMIEEQTEVGKRSTNPLNVSLAYLHFERDRCKTLESKIELISAEIRRRDDEIMRKDDEILILRNSLRTASTTINQLQRRINQQDNTNASNSKVEPDDLPH